MKKNLLFVLAVLSINFIALSGFKMIDVEEPTENHWITIKACNCQTHQLDDEGEYDMVTAQLQSE